MSFVYINSSFGQKTSDFQILDTYYTENSNGITITLKIFNNNSDYDTLNMFFVNFFSECIPTSIPYNDSFEFISFEPYEIKELTPSFCFNFPNNEQCYTFAEINPFISSTETVEFYVFDVNSNCIDGDDDGICDYCSEFDDLPPQNDLEIALTVDNFDDIDYLNSFGVEKIEIFNQIGQKIDNFDEKTIKIVVFYLKNGEITRRKYF